MRDQHFKFLIWAALAVFVAACSTGGGRRRSSDASSTADVATDSTDPGTDATDGGNGTDGTDGVEGTEGVEGTDGGNGTEGTDGVNGTEGTDGAEGTEGTDSSDSSDSTDSTDGTDSTDSTDGTDGTDGGPAPQTCNAIGVCIQQNGCALDDTACTGACTDGAPAQAVSQFNQYVQCVGQTCNSEQGVLIQCLAENCWTSYTSCQGFQAQYGCGGLVNCLNQCPQNDANCQSGCFNSVSTGQQVLQFFSIVECLNETCPNGDQACLEEAQTNGACANLIQQCLASNKPGVYFQVPEGF